MGEGLETCNPFTVHEGAGVVAQHTNPLLARLAFRNTMWVSRGQYARLRNHNKPPPAMPIARMSPSWNRAVPFQIHLPTNMNGKASEHDTSTWISDTDVRGQDGGCSRFQTWCHSHLDNEPRDGRFHSVPLSLSLYLQIKNFFLKKSVCMEVVINEQHLFLWVTTHSFLAHVVSVNLSWNSDSEVDMRPRNANLNAPSS